MLTAGGKKVLMTMRGESGGVGRSPRGCKSPGSDVEVGDVSQGRKGRKSILGRRTGVAKCREPRKHSMCRKEETHVCTSKRDACKGGQLGEKLKESHGPGSGAWASLFAEGRSRGAFYFYFLKIYLFLAVLGLPCCVGFSLVAASRGYSPLQSVGFSFPWPLL